jgi:ribokinase
MSSIFVLSNFIQVGCWFIPQLPQASDTLLASKVHFEPGGKGLNVAVGLRRLGVQVDALIGIGNDAPAQTLLDLFKSEDIDTQYVHRFDGHSGWGSGWIGDNGQYAGAVYLGSNLALTAEHAKQAHLAIQSAKLVYGQFETALPVVVQAFAIAQAHGVPTVLNPSHWKTPPDALRETTETLLTNELEAQYLLGIHLPLADDAAGKQALPRSLEAWDHCFTPQLPVLWHTWPKLERLVVTLGELGCIAYERSGSSFFSAAPQVVAVDSVGAGDAFASGYCHALVQGQSLPQALRAGNACGAHLASRVGVLTALPRLEQLTQLLSSWDMPAFESV